MTPTTHFELPPLGYAYDALAPAYSAELLELHYAVHHQAYVTGANRALANLATMRLQRDFTHLNQLERDLAFHLSGHLLHSLLWRNLAPGNGVPPAGRLAAAIRIAFGGLDSLREQMAAAAMALQGSGWITLSWEPVSGSLLVQQVHDHQHNNAAATLPIMVLDMWEHAYYLQYRNRKDLWFRTYWDLVNWGDVDNRFENVACADLALGPATEESAALN